MAQADSFELSIFDYSMHAGGECYGFLQEKETVESPE